MKWNMISTGDIALRKGGSVDPKKHQDEVFELYRGHLTKRKKSYAKAE